MSKVLWLGWVVLLLGSPGAAQTPKRREAAMPVASATVPAELQAVLHGMVARAGVIFAGHVLEIARGVGFVDVKFRIDEPVRGGNKLGVYVLREWAGLWEEQPQRYRVGERRLMLLTARGPAGMSAPVDGEAGAIPIVSSAVEPLADARGVAPPEDGSLAADTTGMSVDLRWVRTRTTRELVSATGVAAASAAGGPATPVDRWEAIAPIAASLGTPAGRPTVAAVLALLRAASSSSLSSSSSSQTEAGSVSAAGITHEAH